jgi:site-specific DNA-methyltransferase (adenine-specific)
MKPDASFFLNISGSSRSPWLPFELIVRLRPLFVLQNHITWIKSISVENDTVGHFKPVAGTRFLHQAHEHIFHLTQSGDVKLNRMAIGVPYKDKSNIARRGHAADLRCRGNTWFIPYDTIQRKSQKFSHPGTFPIDLPRWCIRLHDRPGGTVLEPSAGRTGRLVAAAIAAGAASVCCVEIDAGNCAALRTQFSIPEMRAFVGVMERDFLTWQPPRGTLYDAITMNPPFRRNEDIRHVRHAYRFLNPWGSLIAVIGAHATFAEDQESQDFRAWLSAVGGVVSKLPDDTFAQEGTTVSTRLVTVPGSAVRKAA